MKRRCGEFAAARTLEAASESAGFQGDFWFKNPATCNLSPFPSALFMENVRATGHLDLSAVAMKLVHSDTELLGSLADLRVASIGQLAIVLDRTAHGLQRRLRILEQANLVEVLARALTPRRGRPEHVLALTKAGREALGVSGGKGSPEVKVHKEVRYVEHQLLITEFRVQLIQLQRFLPGIQVQYLSSTHAGLCRIEPSPRAIGTRSVPTRGDAPQVTFIPDGAFALTHQDAGKNLLFFLEVDRGNEPLTSGDAQRPFLQSKISVYREYLLSERYKRFETILNTPLKGFRLLIVLAGRARLAGLLELVRVEAVTDFVWSTDVERLKDQGCWGPVWIMGGRLAEPPQSILFSRMPQPCPTPGDLARNLVSESIR